MNTSENYLLSARIFKLSSISKNVSLGKTTISTICFFSLPTIWPNLSLFIQSSAHVHIHANKLTKKKATTQVCVNIGIISNVYLQCCVGFRLIWVIELTFTHFYARLTAKVNIARWEEKDSSEHWHGGMSVQSVYTSEEPFCILPKYLQLTRNSIFLLQNNFPRLSRLF